VELARAATQESSGSFLVTNRDAASSLVLLCDHASNSLPPELGSLGLDPAALTAHIAWDPGAIQVAALMAKTLDAVLIESRVSRLVADCNRSLDAPDLVTPLSETTLIPGNRNLSPSERERRIALAWRPFHAAIEEVIAERLARGVETQLVSIHSFTPVYRGVVRPWEIGILHDEDMRLALPMIEALRAVPGLTVGDNQPYAPSDGVYFTLEKHGRSRNLACAMVEIRNDEIADEAGQRRWADLLSGILAGHAGRKAGTARAERQSGRANA